ncbi:hypothetical protein FSP39_014420 [Pinctada imbricata]|uniref:Uncharacterized protein n=1 Tax=Pinctada imbricata TaxID=66713 RepID=A0AA88YSM4_PINIB|nr:hypothetical protein FSP39_014420 [Pinctada imbricata]
MHLLCTRQWKENEDDIMDTSHVIRRFGKNGRGKGNFKNPCGVAVTKTGDIAVADTENHRIQVFTENGTFKHKFGSKGSKINQVNYPMCIVVTEDDHLAITDSVNACVKIFTVDGQIIQVLGGSTIFDIPYGIAITTDGYFVVTDICKHCVVVMDTDGNKSHSFGEYGSKPREFDHPYFVAVDQNNQIIVSDSGNSSIKIFTFRGKVLRNFTQNEFKLIGETFLNLQGVCLDTDGNILVVCNNIIYILAKNGRLWEVSSPADQLSSPKCITYSSAGRLIITQNDVDKNAKHEVCILHYVKEDFASLSSTQFYAISV